MSLAQKFVDVLNIKLPSGFEASAGICGLFRKPSKVELVEKDEGEFIRMYDIHGTLFGTAKEKCLPTSVTIDMAEFATSPKQNNYFPVEIYAYWDGKVFLCYRNTFDTSIDTTKEELFIDFKEKEAQKVHVEDKSPEEIWSLLNEYMKARKE